MIRYAQLDADGYVAGISDLSGEVVAPNMIRLGESEEVTIGMKRVGGAWGPDDRPAPVPGPDIPSEITELKSRQADILFAMVNNNLM